MDEVFNRIAICIEAGKINKTSPYPPDMKGEDGAHELTANALEQGASAGDILTNALIPGMGKVGIKFRENKIFVPQVLMSAKAMNAAMEHLRPWFASGQTKRKGTFVIGTVAGDLHDIGKNLVAMMVEGNGFEVIDLGVDVGADRFLEELGKNPGAVIGLSALLTTTMVNMENITQAIKEKSPQTLVCVGGAPVNQDFCERINADLYSSDPQGLVEYLNSNL
ncbi:MAG: cobalamin-binding protein [Marinilabiliales bacterium]|nr:MAG: cobalamin-binding protein [Marinilabiliales bacterium]